MKRLRWTVVVVCINALLGGAADNEARAQDDPGNAPPTSRLIANLEAGKKQKIVTFGSSLTKCCAWPEQLGAILSTRYPGLVTLHNTGKGGANSCWGYARVSKNVAALKPNTVFIEFAINDARHSVGMERVRKNMDKILGVIGKKVPGCEIIIMIMNPTTGKYLPVRPALEKYSQLYRDIAKERKLRLIDHYPAWLQVLNDDPERFKRYVPDGVHPAAIGCEKVIVPNILAAIGFPAQPEPADEPDAKKKDGDASP